MEDKISVKFTINGTEFVRELQFEEDKQFHRAWKEIKIAVEGDMFCSVIDSFRKK